jgi:hypothetical protein
MANTVPGSTLGTPATGGTNTQGLADWAAPYITNYLGQAQALSEQPYQTYKGPLTAGPSNLQENVFTGLAGLTVPQNLGQSFSSTGAYKPPSMNPSAYSTMPIGNGSPLTGMPTAPMSGATATAAPATPTTPAASPLGTASQYMNPYLQSVLDPQLAELRRQNDITQMNTNAKLTGAGAFGGSRQAIMNAENNRNLMQEMNKTTGTGYANAYDKAMQQFNTEQGQSRDLLGLLSSAGAQQRGIESEGTAADLAEFEKQRQFPYQQVQFQRDMISGLPTSSVTNTPGQLSGIGEILQALGGGVAAAKAFGYSDISDLLKGLGLSTGTPTPAATPAVATKTTP